MKMEILVENSRSKLSFINPYLPSVTDNSLGLSNLGSIGSERALAQQSQIPTVLGGGQFSPWSDSSLSSGPGGKNVVGSGPQQPMRGLGQPAPRGSDVAVGQGGVKPEDLQYRSSNFQVKIL